MTTLTPVSPNQPKTPVSAFRLPPDLKAKAAEKAEREGRTLTSVVIELLTEYVSD